MLALVAQYSHPAALARRVRNGAVFVALHRLEARGFVTRRHGLYHLTRRGRDELGMTCTLVRLVARTSHSSR